MALLGSLIRFRSSYNQIYLVSSDFVRADLVWLVSDLISQFIDLIPLDIFQFGLILSHISSSQTSLVRFGLFSSLRFNST